MQADLRLSQSEVTALSPLRHATPPGAQWLLAAGTAETAAFRWQTAAFSAHLAAQGAKVEMLELPGENHYSAIGVLCQPGPLQAAWLALSRHET